MVPDDALYCSGSNRAVQRDMSRRIVQFQVFMYSDRGTLVCNVFRAARSQHTMGGIVEKRTRSKHHTSNKILDIENSILEPLMHTYQLAAI